MTDNRFKIEEKFWAYLHDKVGICGHCRKKKCAGKANHSVLPDKIDTEIILAAMKQAMEELDEK